MDNASKAIMIGVGLFITVIIISAVLVVVNLGTGAMNNATNSMDALLDNLSSPRDWDGKKDVAGADVNTLLANSRSGKFGFAVTVLTKNGTAVSAMASPTGVGYSHNKVQKPKVSELTASNPIYARTTGTNSFWEFTESTDDGKVLTSTAATASYRAYVIQSRTNSQIGVVFVQN